MKNAFTSRRLGSTNLVLKNAFIKSATFEGMYTNGLPTKELTNHHVAMVKGNVALTTISYGAVSADARTFNHQMYINTESLKILKTTVEEIHKNNGKVSMQLTHCGYFSKNKDVKQPLAPSKVFNEYGCLDGIWFSKEMTIADMQTVSNDFASAALKLKNIGFDAVEIHMGHGYLLSQFLSPYSNKRKDIYGGRIQNRSRFPLELVQNVKQKVGKDFPVLVKLNLSDGFKGGFSLEDCKYVIKELEKNGCDAVVLSGGFTSKTPFYLMRGGVPLREMIQTAKTITEKITMAIFGPFIIKKFKFTENFFLKQANEVKSVTKLPLVYLGGIDSTSGIQEVLSKGFEFIALARPLIHDSEFLLKIENGEISKSECTRCNKCIVEMDKDGVKCVL